MCQRITTEVGMTPEDRAKQALWGDDWTDDEGIERAVAQAIREAHNAAVEKAMEWLPEWGGSRAFRLTNEEYPEEYADNMRACLKKELNIAARELAALKLPEEAA